MGCAASKALEKEAQQEAEQEAEQEFVVKRQTQTSILNDTAFHEALEAGNGGNTWSTEFNGKIQASFVGPDRVYELVPEYEPPGLPPPEIEEQRWQALRNFGLDLQSPEPSLEFITKVCRDIFQVSGCYVMLLDKEDLYMKAASMPRAMRGPAVRGIAFAAHMMLPLKPEMLVVEDLHLDKRFASHPLVKGPPHFRAFCGAPLLDQGGHRIGSLELIHAKPRHFTAEECLMLCNFTNVVMKEMYRLRSLYRQRQAAAEQGQVASPENPLFGEGGPDGVALVDVGKERWPVQLGNQQWIQATGLTPGLGKETCFWDTYTLASQQDSVKMWESFLPCIQAGRAFDVDVVARGGSRQKDLLHLHFKPATLEQLDSNLARIRIPSAADTGSAALAKRVYYFATLEAEPQRRCTPVVALSQHLRNLEMQGSEPAVEGVVLGPLIGRGSSGSVHLALWQEEKVAVKITTTADDLLKNETEQLEIVLGQQMQHPNVVRTLASGTRKVTVSTPMALQSGHTPDWSNYWTNPRLSSSGTSLDSLASSREVTETWIVLELCDLGSLQEAIDRAVFKKVGPQAKWVPDEALILQVALEIASAMTHLHQLGILHSDLNGNNVLLTRRTCGGDGFTIKVSDFGLSRLQGEHRSVATETFGTVTHMPPELLCDGRLTKGADVYAFGVLLWELITGKRPYAGLRHAQIIAQKMKDLPSYRLQWPEDANEAMKAIGQQCLLSDPHERPTFDQLVIMLEKLVGSKHD